MVATSSSRFLSVVTLFFNGSVINNLDRYVPEYLPASYLFFNNLSEPNVGPRPVEEDAIFRNSTFFRKCCPPWSLYESDHRECVQTGNLTSIYNELNITVNLIQSGLVDCPVILDRFVKKKDLRRTEGNGSLTVGGEAISIGNYCVDKVFQNDEDYVVRLCRNEEYCTGGTGNGTRDWCVHKCCADGFGLENYKCTFTEKTGIRVKPNKHIYETVDDYAMMYGTTLNCTVTYWKDFQEVEFRIGSNGRMIKTDDSREYKLNEYCLATHYDTGTSKVSDVVVYCENRNALHAKWIMVRIAVVITCICFVLTLIVYIFVYKLRKLVEQIIACFCLVDLIFWMLFALRIFRMRFWDFCVWFAYIYYFVTTSRLSWLNVLSYEIWRTIGSPRASTQQSRGSLRKHMIYYTVYAVAVPAVFMVFFILGSQRIYFLPESFVPRINMASCFIDIRGLDGNYGQIHLYIPVCILIIINIVFFIRTLIYFLKTKRDLKKIADWSATTRDKMRRSTNKKSFIILKLGLIMGLTWIYYIYAYVSSFKQNEILENIGDIISFANMFEGVYFFVIFVVKWKTVKEILYKLHILQRRSPSTSVSSTTTMTSKVSETQSGMALETMNEQK